MIKGLFFGHTVRCEPAVGFCVRGMFEGKDLGFIYACLILLPSRLRRATLLRMDKEGCGGKSFGEVSLLTVAPA